MTLEQLQAFLASVFAVELKYGFVMLLLVVFSLLLGAVVSIPVATFPSFTDDNGDVKKGFIAILMILFSALGFTLLKYLVTLP